jgi:DNA-binding LacI/PurR family transcriptional regulator
VTSKPAVGRNHFNQAVTRGRLATESARQALRRLIEEAPGPQTTALLIAKAALALGEIENVLNELDTIGRNAKEKSVP